MYLQIPQAQQTPVTQINQENRSPILLERSLTLNKNRRSLRNSIFWGTMNFLILALLVYDLSETCPLFLNYYHYMEYGLIAVLTVNVLYYLYVILRSYLSNHQQMSITLEQKKLLGVKDSDTSYKIVETPLRNNLSPLSTPSSRLSTTPLNVTALSWRSNISQQSDSLNYSLSSPSWTYHKGSSVSPVSPDRKPLVPFSTQASPLNTTYRDTSSVEFIMNDEELSKYLKEQEESERIDKLANKSDNNSSNLLSSFWSHPVTKTTKDISSFLKKCTYQLSTQSPSKLSSSSPGSKIEDKNASSPSESTAMEVWTKLNVDTVALTQWNENLRKWISMTILERLVQEFDRINESLEKHGMNDIKIGCVGLDRLRKTAQMSQITQFIPSLPTLIPFLELHANQEYLVKRIRELARGGCMSEFKWNGGSSYNGKEWDDSLPADCTIIMHLFASYMDTQLLPSPNMPDTKAFSGCHFIKASEKIPTLTPSSLFIQEVTEKPPHYRVVVGHQIYEFVKGYNNLFHSILFFIYQVNKLEHGMLGRVNLGKAGINILWVIGQD